MILSPEETRRLQLVELDMLKEFIAICDKLNLRYYVLGGTMLGAVRHKGFIPWDDDIDVGMLREDYEKFLAQAGDLLPDHLFLQSHSSEPGFYWNAAKIRNSNTTFIEGPVRHHRIHQGIYIDIFPLDNYPATKVGQLWTKFRAEVAMQRIVQECVWDTKLHPLKKAIKHPVRWLYPTLYSAVGAREKLYKSIRHSGMVANYCGQWGKKEVVPETWYAEGAQLEFEGIMVTAPKEYVKWLTQVYGNYMQLPPLEKQVTHHVAAVIDIDRPYTEYFDQMSEEVK